MSPISPGRSDWIVFSVSSPSSAATRHFPTFPSSSSAASGNFRCTPKPVHIRFQRSNVRRNTILFDGGGRTGGSLERAWRILKRVRFGMPSMCLMKWVTQASLEGIIRVYGILAGPTLFLNFPSLFIFSILWPISEYLSDQETPHPLYAWTESLRGRCRECFASGEVTAFKKAFSGFNSSSSYSEVHGSDRKRLIMAVWASYGYYQS